MNQSNKSMLLPRIENINKDFVKIINEIRDPHTFEAPDNFIMEIRLWTLRNILSIIFDEDLGPKLNDHKITKLLENISRTTELAFELDVLPPIWKLVSTANSKEMTSVLNEIHETLEGLVNEVIDNLDSSKREEEQSILHKLVSIDRKLACVVTMDMVFAGLEGVSGSVQKLSKYVSNISFRQRQFSLEFSLPWVQIKINRKY